MRGTWLGEFWALPLAGQGRGWPLLGHLHCLLTLVRCPSPLLPDEDFFFRTVHLGTDCWAFIALSRMHSAQELAAAGAWHVAAARATQVCGWLRRLPQRHEPAVASLTVPFPPYRWCRRPASCSEWHMGRERKRGAPPVPLREKNPLVACRYLGDHVLLLTSMNLRDYLLLKVELEGTSGEGSVQVRAWVGAAGDGTACRRGARPSGEA